jgi:hypothetical protein
MIVFIENRAISLAAIVGINATIDLNSISIQAVSQSADVEVDFSIVPEIELVNGKTIIMKSQISRENLLINESELIGARLIQHRLPVIMSVLKSKLPAFELKVAQSAAQFINQLGQVYEEDEN